MIQNKLEPAGNNEKTLMDTIIEFSIETYRSSSKNRQQKQLINWDQQRITHKEGIN